MAQDIAQEMWLKHPKTGVVWLVTHADTQQRCLADGYTLAPDPRLPQPGPESAPAPAPVEAQQQQPSLVSPDEVSAAADAATAALVTQVQERNDAARKAFGLEPAPRPAAGVRKGVKRAGSF